MIARTKPPADTAKRKQTVQNRRRRAERNQRVHIRTAPEKGNVTAPEILLISHEYRRGKNNLHHRKRNRRLVRIQRFVQKIGYGDFYPVEKHLPHTHYHKRYPETYRYDKPRPHRLLLRRRKVFLAGAFRALFFAARLRSVPRFLYRRNYRLNLVFSIHFAGHTIRKKINAHVRNAVKRGHRLLYPCGTRGTTHSRHVKPDFHSSSSPFFRLYLNYIRLITLCKTLAAIFR